MLGNWEVSQERDRLALGKIRDERRNAGFPRGRAINNAATELYRPRRAGLRCANKPAAEITENSPLHRDLISRLRPIAFAFRAHTLSPPAIQLTPMNDTTSLTSQRTETKPRRKNREKRKKTEAAKMTKIEERDDLFRVLQDKI